MVEIQKELVGILSDNKAMADELSRVKDKSTLSLPGRWETSRSVVGSIAEMLRFGLAEDYWDIYPAKVRALTLDDINRAAANVLKPYNMIWVVIGDRTSIEAGIRELELGEIIHIDTDGNRLDLALGEK